MGGSRASKYLATERDLLGLTVEQKALRSQLRESIEKQPVKAGCVRCFHSSDMLGGFSIVAKGLRPSARVKQQLGRINLDAGAFVTKVSPLDFGFPAHGWLERLHNNNYGKDVEGTSDQPHSRWGVNRGHVCIAVDIPEMVLKDARGTDRNYAKEGRNVHYIPQVVFDTFEQQALPPRNIAYAFRTTRDKPSLDVASILADRFGEAMAVENLFEIRWLLELGAPADAVQRTRLWSLLRSQPDDAESHNIAAFLLQALHSHLSAWDLQTLKKALVGETESICLTDRWRGDKKDAAALLLEVLEPIISSVKKLDLSDCGLGSAGASGLGEALARNIKLESLVLWGNGIGDEGSMALASALEHNRTLQTLALQDNGIRLEGASSLAKALEHNSTLQTLDLWSNDIGSQGASALANALEHNSSLQTLNLCSNGIGPQGASALAGALQQNSSLRSLDLSFNDIGAEGALALREACNHIPVLLS